MLSIAWCALLSFAGASGADAPFTEGFASHLADLWQLSAGAPGRAAIEDGRLALDLSEAKRGKWAYAELHQAFALPARIEWDQCLAHDSQYTWFGGAFVWSMSFRKTEQVQAGLGGSGLKRCVFLGSERGREGVVQPGEWYHLVLEMESTRQLLSVTRRGEEEAVERLEAHVGLSHAPFFITFFQNDSRLGPTFVDEYDQDRGTTWIDNLSIAAETVEPRKPPPPGTTYPFKIPIVRNRATRWLTRAEGLSRGCIAYEAVGRMPLTGAEGVSRWLRLERWLITDPATFPPQPHVEERDGDTTVFHLPEGEEEAVFALRALQWNLEQHPVLEWRAEPQGASWWLELLATDGVRPPSWWLWRSEEFSEAGEGSVSVLDAYRASGRPNRYAEIDFRLHLRASPQPAGDDRGLSLSLTMPGRACVVPRSPTVVHVRDAREEGALLEAVVVDDDGKLMGGREIRLQAALGGEQVALEPVGDRGVRAGRVRGLAPGEYTADLRALSPGGYEIARTEASVTVTDLDFADHYDGARRSYCTTGGKAVGPLLGDLVAWIPYRDIDTPDRQLVLGLKEYQRLQEAGRNLGFTKWRVLPKADIDRFVDYLGESGVTVIRLTPNVSPAEYYLDAGGHLAMHGFEQLSYILAAARRNGIGAIINLFHYPYLSPSTGDNPPVAQYFEAGYRSDFDWRSDEMWEYLSGYLDELVGYLGTDSAVMAYTVMGENDQFLPPEWINRAHDLIKSQAPRQMVVLEQGGSILHCRDGDPASYADYKPASDGGVGFRTYNTYQHPNDCFMAVAMRFFDLARPSFLGEVSCGVNTQPHFVTKLRDAMGLALTLQEPMAIAWSAALLEGERRAFTEASRLIDWSVFERARPPVAVIVDKPDEEQIRRLVQYEEALAALPLDYEYVGPGDPQEGYALVFDARSETVEPDLPPSAHEAAPVRMSEGNYCSYALSSDRRWLVAYVRNATRYEILPCDVGRIVERCRMADQEREVWVELQGFARRCRYRVWEAASGELLREGLVDSRTRLDFGRTTADLLVVVYPD